MTSAQQWPSGTNDTEVSECQETAFQSGKLDVKIINALGSPRTPPPIQPGTRLLLHANPKQRQAFGTRSRQGCGAAINLFDTHSTLLRATHLERKTPKTPNGFVLTTKYRQDAVSGINLLRHCSSGLHVYTDRTKEGFVSCPFSSLDRYRRQKHVSR